MRNVPVIQASNVEGGWLKLLMHLQNSPEAAFQLVFDNKEQARTAYQRMHVVALRRSSWFHMVMFCRDCCVYVLKEMYIKKAVIK